jgi:hypothetical protein
LFPGAGSFTKGNLSQKKNGKKGQLPRIDLQLLHLDA